MVSIRRPKSVAEIIVSGLKAGFGAAGSVSAQAVRMNAAQALAKRTVFVILELQFGLTQLLTPSDRLSSLQIH
jgi:hypothetical protein